MLRSEDKVQGEAGGDLMESAGQPFLHAELEPEADPDRGMKASQAKDLFVFRVRVGLEGLRVRRRRTGRIFQIHVLRKADAGQAFFHCGGYHLLHGGVGILRKRRVHVDVIWNRHLITSIYQDDGGKRHFCPPAMM